METGKNITDKEIDEVLKMIDEKMDDGVSRLKLNFSEEEAQGTVKQQYHHGRCDVGSPWAKGTVSNCDALDRADSVDRD